MISGLFDKFFQRGGEPEDILTVWRKRIFLTIFSCAILAATLPYASNMRFAVNSGNLLIAIVFSLAYLTAILIVFGRFIPFGYRTWIGLLLFYIIGVTSLSAFGRMGSGRLLLIAFAVLTTLLLGLRAGVLALILNTVTYFLWVYGADYGLIGSAKLTVEKTLPLKASAFTFLFMNTLMTVSLGVFVSVLEKKIEKEKRLSDELKMTNKRLERDISAREAVEQALRKSENRYKTLTQNLHVGIFRYTGRKENRFLEANPAMLRMFGFRHRDEIVGLDITDFFQNRSDQDKFGEKMGCYGYVRNEQLALKTRDGTPIVCDVSSVAIRDRDGNVKFYDGVIEDITERVRLEKQLLQAQKLEAVGTLAGGVAHDLNNILSGVVSYPDLILMNLDADSPLRGPIKTVQDSGKKAAAIVQDLLTLARRGVTVSEVIDLNGVIETYLESPEYEKLKAFHPKINIETDLDPDLLKMMGSPVHISKTVMNLVSNAAEAMPDGGRIVIKARCRYFDAPPPGHDRFKEGDYIMLSVSDNGIGMAPEEIERIFEPFYTKKEMGRSGTGLGMAVVWGTVKDHNGSIHVDSTPGQGTTFKIIFPATRKRLEAGQTRMEVDNYHGSGEKILVVDDVREQREVASKILEALDYLVSTVSSGEEAIEFLKSNSVDLIILDMIMRSGEMDGLETYRKILKIHPGQKAIITSGYSETHRVKRAQALGAGQYIRKPYTLQKISSAVKKELTKHSKAA